MSLPDNVSYIVADTETTGVGPDDKVVEIGWVEIDEDFNILNQVESLIDPERFVSPESSGIHGLVNADLANSPTIEEFFSVNDPTCYGQPIARPVVLIGHRISFDERFVKPYITNIVQLLCTLRWFRRLYPSSGNHQLSTAIFALNLPRSTGAHRVMGDVMTAYHLAKHVAERTGLNLRQLSEASAEPMQIAIMPMGKHKDQPLADVPRSYLSWMLNNMDLDFDLKHSVTFALNNKKNK
jgi:exodeoxyribonuclease X